MADAPADPAPEEGKLGFSLDDLMKLAARAQEIIRHSGLDKNEKSLLFYCLGVMIGYHYGLEKLSRENEE